MSPTGLLHATYNGRPGIAYSRPKDPKLRRLREKYDLERIAGVGIDAVQAAATTVRRRASPMSSPPERADVDRAYS